MTKVLKWIGLALFFAAMLLATGLIWYRSASQPQLSGKLTIAGLSAPVDIVRDAEGIPHIYAQSIADAGFALGFVHAQDRLWQMEMNRRIAAGRVAEILGVNALPTDRFLRTLGIRRNAEKILANLPLESRAMLEAYSRGVNAYLANRKGPLPPEFIITGAPVPAAWQAADSLSWQTMMAWDLGANWSQEILRMRMAQRLTLEQITQFLAPYPGDAPLKTQDYTKLYSRMSGVAQQLAAVAEVAPPSYVQGMGSNNWVVAGSKSETGKPLLANDPHLGLSAPSLWYFAHLSAPGLNVIGATLPGLPGVALGRNDRIAWGFTNTAPDVQDLFIERIDPNRPRQYQTPTGWAGFQARMETIRVKGQPDVQMEVRETRHGPVISGVLPMLDKDGPDTQKYAVAFAWTALRPDDMTFHAFTLLNRAGNWEEFKEAMKSFHSPQQNVAYADVDGNIGFVAPARVPIRKPENDLKGLAPAPGWESRYDWAGFIAFDDLPRRFNPRVQQIATANEKIVGKDYPHFITSEWDLPYRAMRIAELLAARPRHNLESFAAMQKDDVSLAAKELIPLLRETKARSERAREFLARLGAWDARMDANRADPLILHAWLREASRRIFADELGRDLMQDFWAHRNFHRAMANVLQDVDGQAKWCHEVRRKGAQPSCGDLLAEALESALADLDKRYGSMAKWDWGSAHAARSEHRPFGKVPALAWLFDIRLPSPGDAFTINVGRNNLRDEEEPFTSRHAASLRALYDLADLENSRFIHSTGQSGNVFSPLYRNFAERWVKAEYVPMRTRRETVEKNSLGVLKLSPQ